MLVFPRCVREHISQAFPSCPTRLARSPFFVAISTRSEKDEGKEKGGGYEEGDAKRGEEVEEGSFSTRLSLRACAS